MKYIILVISLFLPVSLSANPVPEFPFVIVTEKLEKEVKPDVAKVRFSILSYDESSNNGYMHFQQLLDWFKPSTNFSCMPNDSSTRLNAELSLVK